MKVFLIKVNGSVFEQCDGLKEMQYKLKSIYSGYESFKQYMLESFDTEVRTIEVEETDEYVQTAIGSTSWNDLYNS